MIRKYRSFPSDPPNPAFKDGNFEWVPTLSVRLGKRHGPKSNRFLAILDTGSPYCLFHADVGRSIGLDITSGTKHEIGGVVAGARLTGYFHAITLYVEDNWSVNITAGFLENCSVVALLGRRGFFDNFIVRFDHSADPPSFQIEKIALPS